MPSANRYGVNPCECRLAATDSPGLVFLRTYSKEAEETRSTDLSDLKAENLSVPVSALLLTLAFLRHLN